MIRIVSPGLHASVQDGGRLGYRRLGIPWAGALVPAFLRGANALVGNPPGAVAIECFEGGLEIEAVEPVHVALAGLGKATLDAVDPDGTRHVLAAWRGHRIPAGGRVRVRGTGAGRTATLAVAGLAVPAQLGSASTYARAGLGGVHGRALAPGDTLGGAPRRAAGAHAGPEGSDPEGPGDGAGDLPADLRLDDAARAELESCLLGAPTAGAFATVHAVPGPQADAFAPESLERLFAADGWTVSTATDRMGARLDGAPLAHRSDAARDIVSDAIVPGSVQVPGNGLPIVLLSDAHTAGGYPKIATLVSTDLGAVALARPGARLRIVRTDVAGAVARARAVHAAIDAALDSLSRVAPAVDTARLLRENLVDGVTDGADGT